MEAETVMASINCVTFNHVNYIRKALDSFLMQKTDFAFEILVTMPPRTEPARSSGSTQRNTRIRCAR